jgi:hypothetical protein
MSAFINYRNIDFKLDYKNYHASKVSLSAQSSVSAVVLDDGSLLNYAPDGAVIGSLSCEFYLTGSLPSFLNITGTSESSITASFAGVNLNTVYAKAISFGVEPFQPIRISAEFDWYGTVDSFDFTEQSSYSANLKSTPSYLANAYKSYMTTADILGLKNVVSFDYNASCDRPAFYNVDSKIPFRVAKLNKKVGLSLKASNLGSLIDINGKTASTTIYLKDSYGTSLDTFLVSGILTNQNYEVSDGQYLMSSANIIQTVTERKTLI